MHYIYLIIPIHHPFINSLFFLLGSRYCLEQLEKLLPSYMTLSRASNTVKKYDSEWLKWNNWTTQNNIPALPSDDKHIALYLIYLLQIGKSSHSVQGALFAVKWKHETSGYPDPTASLCRNMLQCSLRIAKPQRRPKEPITVDMLTRAFTLINGYEANLSKFRTFCILLLSFVGFLRFSEVINLTLGDIDFYDSHMSLFLEKSKTDVYRDGHRVVISKLNSKICPVQVLNSYIEKGGITGTEQFLFRGVQWLPSKSSYSLREKNKPISYSTARSDMLDMWRDLGLDPNNFGLHSARSGGATCAANNGVRDRLFKRHGRWKSTSAKDSYVKDNLESLLTVSQNLGL